MWMLEKSGHGRTVRFINLGSSFSKHTDLLNTLNAASTIDELRLISSKCLIGVYDSGHFAPDS